MKPDLATAIHIAGYYALAHGEAFSLTAADVNTGVPEPASWAIMLVGFCGLGAMLRRRQSQDSLAA